VYSPVDGADAGHVVLRADALGQQPVADLPREHGGVLTLVVGDGVDDGRRRHFGFASSYDAGLEAARLVISADTKNPWLLIWFFIPGCLGKPQNSLSNSNHECGDDGGAPLSLDPHYTAANAICQLI
jgi:hypothetical protein